ncbi:TonB-dependent receptor [Bacteroides nordii]|uniref:TonB-dependent receptor n=1 Tax=Bacteroides nordii TaxID=291645 RepID=UPI00189CB8CF|nr:TonB-dependent receptor [Bacteroides nordii]MBD9111962.1 TonB-dependent receptor [Bacteroides nordii]MCE8466791.1 TonB-dependent receptor [Bacteroides nordii]MCQ4915310.1 TonB-dependent receptor [Bacteroides nordii]UYU48411.1 TonB-dependent receptor [Bacteroides nordii]
MKRLVKLVSLILLFLNMSSNTFAEEKVNVVKQGTIRGRIIDASKQTLPGASIYIENLRTGVTSDVNGYYTFSNLNPGTYTIKISYVGYSPVEMKITIPAGKTLEKDVVLNEGLELQEVVVGGAFQGQRRAINSQKNSLGITNVVSADQVGKFPDSNIGDALKRISGINVQYDQGEARFGQVRGTSADLSSVTINGNRIPSAEGDTRNVQLDLIPADMIQTIEVNKVVTPDMDGDAIGGSINLVTKNSPYKRTITATAGSGYNWISEKAQLNLGFTYGDRFFNDKLGIMLSASYQNAPSGSDDVEFVWDTDSKGTICLTDYQIRQYYVTRERQSYSAAFDWDINANHKLFFKGIFNNRNDWENRYRLTLKDLNKDVNKKKEGAVADNKASVRLQTKAGSPNNRNARLERQRTMDFTLGGEHLFGKLSMDWNASYARASEERPNERYLGYELKKQNFDIDLSDIRRPYASAQAGSTLILNNDFSLQELTEQQEDIVEKDLKFSMNFKLPLVKGFYSNQLRFGAKVVDKSKDKDLEFYDYEPVDEKAFNSNSFSNTNEQNRNGYMPGEKYKAGTFISKEYVGGLDLNNSSLFNKTENLEELAGEYKARETVTAGYLRFDQNFGKKLSAMVGLRLENTHLKYNGRKLTLNDDGDPESLTVTPDVKDSYLNILPSVLLKYNVNEDFKIRGSFTETLSRPKYSALIPNVNINNKDSELTLGNPELKPTTSFNFDLSADYYFKSVGLVSIGIYYKDINDFIVTQTVRGYEYEGNSYDKFMQPRNAGDANLLGVEVGYQRDFGFIAPTLKCVGFYGTYTYTHSKVNNFNFTGRENEKDLKLPGSPEHTANASLYFEKGGLNVRLSYNFASDFIDEMGESAFYDRYYDKVNYMDVNASYTFGKKLRTTFYAEANNLLNQPLRYYQGISERTMQSEHYGVKVNAGVKINF